MQLNESAGLAGERASLARATRLGIGMPAAGLLFWLSMAALIHVLPLRTALVLSFFAKGAVFPLGRC